MPVIAPKQSFSQSAKIRLVELNLSIVKLARRVGSNRTNCSLVIHQKRKLPKLEKKIRRELDLEETRIAEIAS